MRINHNIAALNTYRQYNNANAAQSKTMEKLSSGMRINSAADDAAGLAISEKMRSQVRGLDQASRNAQDGMSMIQTAEGALNETHDILQRMRELSVQAGNDTNTIDDRKEIQKEMNQLTSEVNRIGNTTEFNTQKLLKGKEATGQVTVATTQAGQAAGTVPAVAGKATAENAADLTADVTGLTNADATFSVAGTDFTLANDDIIALKDKNGAEAAAYIADKAVDTGGKKLSSVANVSFTNGKLTVESKEAGTDNDVSMSVNSGTAGSGGATAEDLLGIGTAVTVDGADATTAPGTVGESTLTLDRNFAAGDKLEVNGKTYTAVAAGETPEAGQFAVGATTDDTASNLLTAIKAGDNTVDATSSASGSVITLKQATATTAADPFAAQVKSEFTSNLQIGANAGQNFMVELNDMRATALGISGSASGSTTVTKTDGTSVTAKFSTENSVSNGSDNNSVEAGLDVSTAENASKAISVIDKAISNVSAERSKLGAYQNRLDHTINNLGTTSENITAAESRVRDTDMAKTMMEQTKNSILAQASQAMLSQANQQPQQVLQLLR